ncbi:MAG TPA: glycosyltransferase family 39 protein [Polyangiaceae bacterium]|nr:glycosyltransferase family 39 protein [Polyangiaceae bacterium]
MAEESARASDAEAPTGASGPGTDSLRAPLDAEVAAGNGGGSDGLAAALGATALPAPAPAKGRSTQWVAPAIAAAALAAIPLIVMCAERRFGFSVPLGTVTILLSSVCLLVAIGSMQGDAARVTHTATVQALTPRLVELTASVALHLGVLALCVAGVLPKPIATAAVLVPATFLWVTAALYRFGRALGAWPDEPGVVSGLLSRHGFWLVVVNVLLYMPLLGSYSLSDPWETHYGEVAREMLARDDWISTWWAQDGWFWSKPVLDFWIQALDFSMLGVHYMPDKMLEGAAHGLFPQPEWAARMPVFVLTLLGAYAMYRAVAKALGRRVGFVAGVVLTTMPYWYLIAHQTMTDMPYVGPLAAAMALALLGFVTDANETLPLTEIRVFGRTLRFSALHLVLVAVIASTLPQVLYLVSRDLTLHLRPGMRGFRFHPDEFFSGSGEHNCGLPGNQACQNEQPVHKELWPIHAALIWAAVCGAFLYIERKVTSKKRVYFLGSWYFLALSMLGKGAPGLVLPIVAALGFVAITRRWKDLESMSLGSMVLVVACVGLPWYVQMFIRHGPPFIDRLIMHDMYKRAFVHVHDTNQGDDTSFRYYIWQLGYGLFPWTGLGAGGLLWWLRRSDRTRDGEGDLASLMMAWFLAAFGMFTITLTKFHHYILPLVPAVAAVTGVLVDRMMGKSSAARPGKLPHYFAASGAGLALVVYGVSRLFPRRFMGEALNHPPASKAWGVALILAGAAAVVFAVRRFGAKAEPAETAAASRYDGAMFAILGLASAIVVALVGRDLFTTGFGGVEGQMRLLHLFTYNYSRPWPETLDFTGALVGFTVVAALLSLGLMVNRLRSAATFLFATTAVLWTAWGLDVYLYKAAPHWGQRETILAYYRDRTNENQPFVAYQMNWKGENFYTGNHVPAFVSSGEKFKEWVNQQKTNGIKRVYFITEHSRTGTLRRELGDPKSYKEITDKALNNKFVVSRIEF